MTDPFSDVTDDLMTRATDLGGDVASAPAPPPTNSKTKKHVCPYCGAVTAVVEKPTGPCPRCNMEDTPATRAATKARIGPWYVLQTRNPSSPGMKWATLLSLVSKGQVTPRSVVRGPTTHQLWKFAAHVKGLSREFNLCYSCGGEIERTVNQCPHCDRLQEPPINPDSLLESRDMAPRGTIQREIKPAALPASQTTDMIVASDDRRRNPDDGILSAKELAAAFQLDFNPSSQPQTEMTLAAPFERPRKRGRAFVAVLLLVAIGGGAVLYAKPEYREKTVAWLNTAYTSIKNSMEPSKPAQNSMPWESGKKSEEPIAPAPTPASEVVSPAPEVVTPAPSPDPVPTPTDESITGNTTPVVDGGTDVKPLDGSTTKIETPKVEAPKPEEPKHIAKVEKIDVTPTPPVVVPDANSKPKPGPAALAQAQQEKLMAALDAPVPDSLRDQGDLAKLLWNGAIDKEREQDYPLSIKCYQKLKQLDASVRQSNKMIDKRMEFAKDQLPR